jgi:uncharacterized protein
MWSPFARAAASDDPSESYVIRRGDDERTQPGKGDPIMSNIPTVQAMYEAFGRGDVPTILSYLDEDIAWDQDTPSFGLPWYEARQGRAAIPQFFEALANSVDLYKFEPLNFLEGGNQVAGVINVGLEVKRTGKRVEDIEVHLWTFGPSGKVTRFAHVMDRHSQVLAYF